MTKTTVDFGKRLQQYRKEHLLTQKKMAELLGISTNHVGVLERGRKQPRASTEAALERLSRNNIKRMVLCENDIVQDSAACDKLWCLLCQIETEKRNEVMSLLYQLLKWIGE